MLISTATCNMSLIAAGLQERCWSRPQLQWSPSRIPNFGEAAARDGDFSTPFSVLSFLDFWSWGWGGACDGS